MSTVTILPISEYEIGKEYTPEYDAKECKYFIPVILWRETPVTTRMWYSDGYELIEGSRVTAENNIAVIRSVMFVINMSTGAIKIEDYNQTNLQSTATWFIEFDSISGIGLIGIKN